MSDSVNTDDFILFSPPTIGAKELHGVEEALLSAWITTGPKTAQFERQFQQLVGAPAALALNSCTSGLHLALRVLDVGPGDEVVTTTLTFASTVNVIEHVGARPVLVDVEPDTLNIDPRALEQAITGKTKAIIVVHYAGHPADLDAVSAIAERHHLHVVEDAAHALPAAFHGRPIGSSTNLTAFSFYATKNLTTGEGGMLTGDPELVDRARTLSLHGMSRNAWKRYEAEGSWRYDIVAPGFKCNMTDIQAALGLAQLDRLQQMQQRRKEIVASYHRAFAGIAALEVLPCRPGIDHAWHLYVIRLNRKATPMDRNRFIELLRQQGIGTSVHFTPMHMHSYYRNKYGYRPNDFPVAYCNFQRMLSLPLSPAITDPQVDRVIAAVLKIVAPPGRQVA